jgi:hypothetical protein
MTGPDRLLEIRKQITDISIHQWMLRTFHKMQITTEELCDLLIWDGEQLPHSRLSPDQRTELEFTILRPEWLMTRRLENVLVRLEATFIGFGEILEEAVKLKGGIPAPAKPKA